MRPLKDTMYNPSCQLDVAQKPQRRRARIVPRFFVFRARVAESQNDFHGIIVARNLWKTHLRFNEGPARLNLQLNSIKSVEMLRELARCSARNPPRNWLRCEIQPLEGKMQYGRRPRLGGCLFFNNPTGRE